jgi:hypothetical protein
MPIKQAGNITFTEIANEFGGTVPHSLSEYYRGGSRVPDTPSSGVNNRIPTSGEIKISDFYGTSRTTVVTYEIIGGGGSGGFGLADGYRNTQAPGGQGSSITGIVSVAGGTGGSNAVRGKGDGYSGGPGQGTVYGPGGAGVPQDTSGNPAPSTSYGAGGGGGGGDSPSTFDKSGGGGQGGNAAQRLTGTFTVQYGTVVSGFIGAGGVNTEGVYKGGSGAGGFCRLTYDGVTRNFTSPGNFSTTIN